MVVLSIELRGGEKRVAAIKASVRQLMPQGFASFNELVDQLSAQHEVGDVSYVISKMIEQVELVHVDDLLLLPMPQAMSSSSSRR